MTAIAVWLKDILPQTPGASRAVAKRELLLACREFFEQSAAWREVLDPLNVVPTDEVFTMTDHVTDANSEVTKILSVEYRGRPLRPLSRRPPGEYLEATSPSSYYVVEPDEIHLWPRIQADAEIVTDALTVQVALIPVLTATVLPDVAEKLYYDAIRDGLLGRMYSHPAKPYSNPTLGTYHLQRFQAAIGKYAARAKAGNGPSWTFPQFGK